MLTKIVGVLITCYGVFGLFTFRQTKALMQVKGTWGPVAYLQVPTLIIFVIVGYLAPRLGLGMTLGLAIGTWVGMYLLSILVTAVSQPRG